MKHCRDDVEAAKADLKPQHSFWGPGKPLNDKHDSQYGPVFDTPSCITSPSEFARAFINGDTNRCVDPNLIVRLDTGIALTGDGASRQFVFNSFKDKLVAKAVTFWSTADNPAKYIRIGRSRLVLGNNVDLGGNDNGLLDANFAGIQSKSNFAALLEAIGLRVRRVSS